MDVLDAIILGIIQGLTEFLPVSSSGHLVLFQNILDTGEVNLFFDTMLHVGTLVSVVIVFRKDIIAILKKPIQKLTGLLIIATIPAVVITLIFSGFIESTFEGQFLGYGFLWTAVLLTLSEKISKRGKKKKDISYSDSALIGCMQAIAILPGISRSGSTLSGGLLCGIDRNEAARFAFLMSIPVILGSIVFQGYKVIKAGTIGIDILPLAAGTIASIIAGFFAVKFMLNIVRKRKLYGFAIYVLILGIFVLLDQHVLHLVF